MLLGANLLFPEKKGGLPYDAEVEYLQGDGVARIMLDDRYATEKKYMGIGITEESYTGMFAGSQSGRRMYYVGAGSGIIVAYSNGTRLVTVDEAVPYKCYDFIADGVSVSISLDGNVLSSSETTVKIPKVATTNNMELFAIRGYSSATTEIVGTWAGLCYYFKLVSVEGETVLDLIPVRKGSVGYMYDRVSGKLYGNAGEGAFIVGPDKGLPYDAEVEYLQGDGVAYIDGFIDFGDETCKTLKIDASVTVADGAYEYDNSDEWFKSMFAIVTRTSLSSGNLMVSLPTLDEGWDEFIIRNFANGKTVKADLDENPVTITFYKDSDTLSVMNVIKNGVTVRTDNRTSFTSHGTYSGYTPILFGVKTETGAIQGLTKGKLIAFKCKNLNTGEEVDMIPVRKGGVGYMYDKISGQLFGNAADSGAFIVGPDK